MWWYSNINSGFHIVGRKHTHHLVCANCLKVTICLLQRWSFAWLLGKKGTYINLPTWPKNKMYCGPLTVDKKNNLSLKLKLTCICFMAVVTHFRKCKMTQIQNYLTKNCVSSETVYIHISMLVSITHFPFILLWRSSLSFIVICFILPTTNTVTWGDAHTCKHGREWSDF